MAAISSIFSKVPAPPLPQPKITASVPGAKASDVFEGSNATLVRLAVSVLKDSHLAQALTDQQQKADDAINTLSQAKKGLVSDAKSAALQKLELARRRLQLLRSLGGDPKVVAQQAKQIAQQIAAAAKEYAGAVASEGGDASPSAEASTPGTSATPATEAGGADQGASASNAATVTGTDVAAPVETPSATAAPTAAAPSAETSADKTPAAPADDEAARQRNVQAYQDASANASAQAQEGKDERQALEKFRDVADDAKRLIEESVRKLKARNANDPAAAEAERAKVDLDQQVQNLGDAIGTQQIDTAGADGAIGAQAVGATALVAINLIA